MKRWITYVVVFMAFISCNNGLKREKPELDGYYLKPTEQIDKIPLTRAEEGFVEAGNEFAGKLARKVWEIQNNKGSFLVSPLSVQYVLGMAGNGADGSVAQQMAQALGYEGTDAVNVFCNKLITHLPMVDTTVTLALANALLARDICPLNRELAATLEEAYEASVESMSFQNPKAVVDRVNVWCREHTYGRIDRILEEILPDAVLYLMNAIYFSGNWMYPFKTSDTKMQKFQTLSGKKANVRMMHRNVSGSYEETQAYQKISLPYGRGKYLMNVLLPKEGVDIPSLLGEVSGLPVLGMARDVKLSFPKFESELFMDLAPLLFEMGVPEGSYDKLLAPGTTNNPIMINRILHKANITVDEGGTEAAAVTVAEFVAMGSGPTLPPSPVEFTADHTFIYTITETTSGVILFVGVFDGN